MKNTRQQGIKPGDFWMKRNSSLEIAYWHMRQQCLPEACKSFQEIIQTNSSILFESLISKSEVYSDNQFNSTNSMGEHADKYVKSPN